MKTFALYVLAVSLAFIPARSWALSSANIPLDSAIYLYLEKLAGFGLVASDIKGIRPYSRAEAARLLVEAEANLDQQEDVPTLAAETVSRLRELLPREALLCQEPERAQPFEFNPLVDARLRYVFLDGAPRSYERLVYDPGNDGVFGIGAGLRPKNPYPSPVRQRGNEGTPLLENNEGVRYNRGSNFELRFSSEAYLGRYAAALVEPLFLKAADDEAQLLLNKGYVKLGGDGLELEAGRDANWLGFGYRGNITLTNNARNFDLVKISSPEPVHARYLGDLKYALIVSQFDRTITNGQERQPFFVGAKLSLKPTAHMEFGINLGRQVGGPGVKNSFGDSVRGLVGGTGADNSNSLAGLELRFRFPWLRYSELYGEYSGEDAASFWPIVESYVAGFYIPRLTEGGRDDLRFEYFLGNQILYTNGTFPEGYIYEGMPIGHSQGGAAQEFFIRYSHWFSVRNNLALEYFHTERGNVGRLTVDSTGGYDANGVLQAVERKNAGRIFWAMPLFGNVDMKLMYGCERIHNVDLVGGAKRTNQIVTMDMSYRY